MPTLKFYPSGTEIEVKQGTTVLQAAQKAGLRQDAPCGGHGKCGKCRVRVNGQEVLACQTKIADEDLTVTATELPQDAVVLTGGVDAAFSMQPVAAGKCHISIDIGTTTVVVYLLDGNTGEILGTETMLNPQFPYGADVISRIQAALNGNLAELTAQIRNGIWELVTVLCREHGYSPDSIGVMAVVGNPAMQQLFMGISPENLARPPFAPLFTQAQTLALSDYFPLSGAGRLLVVPDIAGYVGADTMGCVLATGLWRKPQMTLLLDIGTNGEMVLGNRDRMVSCSTATGPAFEGGRISCGMRGSRGAIDHMWLKDNRICYSVIGGGEETGLCGSGLIDAVALLLELGVLNKRGRIQKDYQGEGSQRSYALTRRLTLTQDDIREVQMAKGAIAAGIVLMTGYLGIRTQDIEQVLLCGAFGNYMNPKSACRIGLLPQELLSKIRTGGNAAGMGSRLMALDREAFFLTDTLAKKIEPLELASFPGFQRTYSQQMIFPESVDRKES